MKYVLILMIALFSCTRGEIHRSQKAFKPTRGSNSVKAWKECEHLRDTIISMIEAQVPEIHSTFIPFAKSYAKSEKVLPFGGLTCSDAASPDTSIHGFHQISIGFGDGTDEYFTVETFYISDDLKSIYVRGPGRTKVLIEEARKSTTWKDKWH